MMITIIIVLNIASIYVIGLTNPDCGNRSPGFRSKLCSLSQMCSLVTYSASQLPINEMRQIAVSVSLAYYKD